MSETNETDETVNAEPKAIQAFRFGLLPPTAGGDLVRDQMRAAHRYRNDLTAIERARRHAVRSADVAFGDVRAKTLAVDVAKATYDATRAALAAVRAESRSRSETEAQRAAVTEARDRLKLARVNLFAARKANRDNPHYAAEVTRISDLARDLRKSFRAGCGVYWGTYLLVESAMDQVAKAPLYDGSEPNDPRFVRWQGDGRVGVQIQGGEDIDAIFDAKSTGLRIDSVSDAAWHSPVRSERRRAQRARIHLRVGSTTKGAPVWATWPMMMSREIPRGSRVKSAVVSLHRDGVRDVWSVVVTVELPLDRPREACGNGSVAIDLGWRVADNGIRVATWVGDDGATGKVVVPARLIGGAKKVHDLGSIRDLSFNQARARLVAWLHGREVPEWLTKRVSHIGQWKSQERMTRLAREWSVQRFAGDDDGYIPLEAWRYHDHHLLDWEANQRANFLFARREVYRIASAELTRRYGTIVLEKFDLREVAKKPSPEEAEHKNEGARANRQLAAPSVFRQALVNACRSRSAIVVSLDPSDSTRTCAACGLVEEWDSAATIHHACSGCGAIWDQDENAARVLLGRHLHDRDRSGHATAQAPAKQQTKWAKRKENAAARIVNGNPTESEA